VTRPIVDALGTWCPVPIRLLADRVRSQPDGAELVLLADDPLIEVDLPAWCHESGHELVSLRPEGDGWRAVVRVRTTSSRVR